VLKRHDTLPTRLGTCHQDVGSSVLVLAVGERHAPLPSDVCCACERLDSVHDVLAGLVQVFVLGCEFHLRLLLRAVPLSVVLQQVAGGRDDG
jgi:hypothetical protein